MLLLLLKVINALTNFSILSDILLFKNFSLWQEKLMQFWFLPINKQIWCHNDIIFHNWVNLIMHRWNEEYIILCNFGDSTMICFEVIEWGLWGLY